MQRVAETCRRLLSERGEANSVAIAADLLDDLLELQADQRLAFFELLEHQFGPDPGQVLQAAQRYAESPNAEHLIQLTAAAEPPRQELLRRLNRAPGGTAGIVSLRRALLGVLKSRPDLAAVEADFQHLLSSWFNAGFLQMEQVDWRSPAALLERIIEHEAVHAIDGWTDLRRRLQPDRRCFAFFHPQLPGEPLIFVEVALLPHMPEAIGPLIDPASASLAPRSFKVATFYSISNCQPGLKGVSLGNFLIKQVAEHLQREFPQLRTFCTLSPIPGLCTWLRGCGDWDARDDLRPRLRERLGRAHALLRSHFGDTLASLPGSFAPEAAPPELREALELLAAHYLGQESVTVRADPVARFHLGNGARLERINWAADVSRKGLKQSLGLMVNYLYDLGEVEERHERFVRGEVVSARRITQKL
ncbi:malonyl-CoA decarboxylase [Schlegelella sp. S2-27]|uniref:Malonyl-CoA decarboxylase n=1 Tax=Caldimonas mangrovi TaxID=2944811 RepID=A0ABT0YQL4_9BURK|nr:malonyl-CoA decarboxylase [Caldimonas mangrovi]MCM5680614.1 malonyl-CoA decarboxylase [Caldimonas mangrovi]